MKKTKLTRETAYLAAPQIADGFVPPAGFDYKISVSLHEVDVKIYGFDGQSWSLLHDTDGLIPSYIADIQHQKYYLESKTGSEQLVRVSFLSSEDEDSGIRTGGTPGNTRFYDIEEIPVYNGSRDGAMLTVMSDGSLAWLLANESFIVPEEGGEEGGNEGGGGNVIAGTFIEELTSASNNLSNGALITNNVFVKPTNASVTLVSLDTDNIVDFNVDGTRTEEEMTLSMWFNPDSTSWTGWKYIAGNAADSNNEFRLAISKNGSGNIEFKTILWDLWTGSPKGISSKPLAAGEWTHLAMTWSYNGSTYDLKLFVDGVKCGELLNQNRNLMKMASNRNFALGALAFGGSVTGSSLPCSIDSVQIKSGTALTDSQVAAIAGQSDRQMSIETAAQG